MEVGDVEDILEENGLEEEIPSAALEEIVEALEVDIQ